MSPKRLLPLALSLLLLTGCSAPAAETPPPTEPPPPEVKIEWLHGFYAVNSYPQMDYALQMDEVSVGWAQLQYIDDAPFLNDTYLYENDWIRPSGGQAVLDELAGGSIPCNLNVFAAPAALRSIWDNSRQEEAIAALVDAAEPYAGLTIDFEGLREVARSEFSAFMAALRTSLPKDKTLYVCVPPDTWYGGYDYRVLGDLCDRVILMAHDYQWTTIPAEYVGGANTYSPLSPLNQISTALRHVTDPDTGVRDVSRIALQIAFNSCGFHVDEDGNILDTTLYHPATSTLARRLAQPDSVRDWDERSGNPSLWYYTEDGNRYRIWYEDAQSVWAKLELAAGYGVTGVSIWRLGIIPDHSELEQYDVWALLRPPS